MVIDTVLARTRIGLKHQENVQFILCPFATWLFPPFSAFSHLFLLLPLLPPFESIKSGKSQQNVAKGEKAMPPYPFASFFRCAK